MSVADFGLFTEMAGSGEAGRQRPSQAPLFLLGTLAHNQHVQNIAAALHEMNALGAFRTSGADHWPSEFSATLRRAAGTHWPGLNQLMSRRRITTVPPALVESTWKWEAGRLIAARMMRSVRIEDWFWERNEKAMDQACARLIETDAFGAFLGVEFGALQALKAAKAVGKPGVVAFLSPHHKTREKWEDAEYERFPELLTPARSALLAKARERGERLDEEAAVADVIHCASEFTRRSLVSAGVSPEKIICVPLGCPEPFTRRPGSPLKATATRFLSSGPVSVRKGAHILLDAWRTAGMRSQAELHFYGRCTVPARVLAGQGDKVFFHGSVSRGAISRAYQEASILVFPTLCDGFGMVVGEAFAHGLPVITTPNAGAADLIVEGRNGFIVPPRDPEALADRMAWCADHPEEVAAMGEEALKTAREWSWTSFRHSFQQQLLDQLAASGERPGRNKV